MEKNRDRATPSTPFDRSLSVVMQKAAVYPELSAPFVPMGAIVIELSNAVKRKINDFVVRISVYPKGALWAVFFTL
jgi:hypothetical protein